MLANLWNILANKPVNPSYVAAFGIMFLGSATLLTAKKLNIYMTCLLCLAMCVRS
jgi:hypothetical protein